MNITDLRIAFKIDTGNYPLWTKTHDGKSMHGTDLLRGYPRTIYGLWLEDQIGKTKYLRDRYFHVIKDAPTKFYFGRCQAYNGLKKTLYYDILYGKYIEWLETFILKFKPEIIHNIINVD